MPVTGVATGRTRFPRPQFEPPRPPQLQPPSTTVINGQTYVGAPKREDNAMGGAPNTSYGAGTIWGEDGSTWTPMQGAQGTPRIGAAIGGGDPRIEQLLSALSTNSSGMPWNEPEIPGPDFSGLANQQSQLESTLRALQTGGVGTPNVTNDPEAVAYRAASDRATDQARQAEAERMGASGMTGSGDSDARLAQLREAAGQDVAGFTAGLANRRREQNQAGAVSGANLSLQDLQRQMAQQQAIFGGRLEQANMRRQAAGSQRQQQMELLRSLLAAQGA